MHLKTPQGIKNMSVEEAAKIAAENPHRRQSRLAGCKQAALPGSWLITVMARHVLMVMATPTKTTANELTKAVAAEPTNPLVQFGEGMLPTKC